MELNELKAVLRQNGVVGAGGAGFPSYGKLNEKADTLILNCAECEPLLRLHRQLLKKHTREILTALNTVREILGAERAIVAIKPSARHTIEAIKACTADLTKISIGLLPEVYPAGDEVIAIYETTGRVVQPGQLPISVGVIVYNVETMYNTYRALTGAGPVTYKYVTVNGAVKNPATLRLPLGMTFEEAVNLCGGPAIRDYRVLCGGPMTGKLSSLSDVVTKTTNGILILPADHNVVMRHEADPGISYKRAMSACCQCRMCTDLCPRNLLGHPIEPHRLMQALSHGNTGDKEAFLNTFFCCSCGLCEMYSCFQGLSPRTLINMMKGNLRSAGIKAPAVEAEPVRAIRDGRRISKNRLIARLGLTEYNSPAYLDEVKITCETVTLKLSQHIGAPAVPVVKPGEFVRANQMIASPAEGALSVAIHTPIQGLVREVNDRVVVIDYAEEEENS